MALVLIALGSILGLILSVAMAVMSGASLPVFFAAFTFGPFLGGVAALSIILFVFALDAVTTRLRSAPHQKRFLGI